MVKDLATLKALADPLRRSIVSLLDEARTVKEMSARIGKPADRLYYHLGLLEKHGLVRAIEARGEERRYVVTASTIEIDPSLTLPAATADRLVRTALDEVRDEYAEAIRRTRPGGKKRVMLAVRHVELTEAERVELTERLQQAVNEYVRTRTANGDSDRDGGERETFGVVAGVWPAGPAADAKDQR